MYISYFIYVCIFKSIFHLSNRRPKITPILTLYQVNAATLTPFSKEDKIFIKNLYECKGYNTRQLITEFPDKDWTKNNTYGEVEKFRNSRHVIKQCDEKFSSLLMMQFRTNIN